MSAYFQLQLFSTAQPDKKAEIFILEDKNLELKNIQRCLKEYIQKWKVQYKLQWKLLKIAQK